MGLRKRMIFYFLLIALANVFVAAEFVIELNSDSYRAKFIEEVRALQQGSRPAGEVNAVLDKLARKFVIMICVLIVVSAVVLFLFVIQIASPIQYMIDQANRMSEGDLRIRINIRTKDEIAVLGNLINDLSINLQEVLAQLDRLIQNLKRAVSLHHENLKTFPNIRSYFDEETAMLDQLLKEFELLKQEYTLFTIEGIDPPEDK